MRNIQTQDLFAAARVLAEIGLKEEIKAVCKKTESVTDIWARGYELVYTVFEKAAQKGAEQKIYEFISGILGKSADDVRTADLIDTLDDLTQVADVEQWKAFFTRLAKLMKLK